MFDQFMDLPLHALVLHLSVILLPISAVVTALVAVRPYWREDHAGKVALLNVAMLALTFVTVRSGYALQEKLDPTKQAVPSNDHEKFGERLLWVMVALTVVAVIAWAVSRTDHLPPIALTSVGVLVALLALGALGLAIVTGHTGSDSHWGGLYE